MFIPSLVFERSKFCRETPMNYLVRTRTNPSSTHCGHTARARTYFYYGNRDSRSRYDAPGRPTAGRLATKASRGRAAQGAGELRRRGQPRPSRATRCCRSTSASPASGGRAVSASSLAQQRRQPVRSHASPAPPRSKPKVRIIFARHIWPDRWEPGGGSCF